MVMLMAPDTAVAVKPSGEPLGRTLSQPNAMAARGCVVIALAAGGLKPLRQAKVHGAWIVSAAYIA